MPDYNKMFPASVPNILLRSKKLQPLRDCLEEVYFLAKKKRYTKIDWGKLFKGCIPVIINNFNRLETLDFQVKWLLSLDKRLSIIILDNDSTYPPLLTYYERLNDPRVQVVHLGFNSGIRSIKYFARQLKGFEKYIVTDADLIPYASMPQDLVTKMSELLDAHPDYNHVGVSLEINDIPCDYPFQESVRLWESQYWEKPVDKAETAFIAKIDTTLAMYRSTSDVRQLFPALRLNRPYTMRHVDWYTRPGDYSEEYLYYLRTCKTVATWSTKLKNWKNPFARSSTPNREEAEDIFLAKLQN